ncbi:hypothetical protein FACS1894208_04640 [Clostridia bacterium]|nr:hypothetical protein FACS1894208_04640 [Clostridia bacterium]
MLPRLIIRQDFGMLSIESTPAQVRPRVTRMEMTPTKTPGRLDGAARFAKVKIDQTEAFASSGNKPVLRVASDNARSALQDGLNTIGRIASEGLLFMKSAEVGGGDPSAISAKQTLAQQMESVQLTVRSMPSAPVDIDVVDGDVQMNWTPSELNIEWRSVSHSEGYFTPADINVTWLQRPSIEITLDPGTEFLFPVNTGIGTGLDVAT